MADEVHVTVDELYSTIRAALTRSGLSPEAAEHTADSLSEAECCGKRTHGLIRLENICAETARRQPDQVRVDREGDSFLALDGGRHTGYHPGAVGIRLGAEKAEKAGLCFTGIHNTAHSGMLGFYARRIARAGLWGLVMTHCTPLMAPYGGSKPVFGTNAIALGVPLCGEAPLVVDFSSASLTYGAVMMAQKEGTGIPAGTALDSRGRPTTDPAEVMAGGTLLPAAGVKGSALALMLQLFCGPLTGASPIPARGSDYGLCFLQIRPDLFHRGETTDSGVKQILRAILDCAPAAGHESVCLPGTDSHLALERAWARGLGVDRGLWERGLKLAGREPTLPPRH